MEWNGMLRRDGYRQGAGGRLTPDLRPRSDRSIDRSIGEDDTGCGGEGVSHEGWRRAATNRDSHRRRPPSTSRAAAAASARASPCSTARAKTEAARPPATVGIRREHGAAAARRERRGAATGRPVALGRPPGSGLSSPKRRRRVGRSPRRSFEGGGRRGSSSPKRPRRSGRTTRDARHHHRPAEGTTVRSPSRDLDHTGTGAGARARSRSHGPRKTCSADRGGGAVRGERRRRTWGHGGCARGGISGWRLVVRWAMPLSSHGDARGAR